MPMVAATLATQLHSALAARSWFNGSDPSSVQLCTDIATAVVAFLQANATVVPTTLGVPTLVAPSGGGPVTGVGSLT